MSWQVLNHVDDDLGMTDEGPFIDAKLPKKIENAFFAASGDNTKMKKKNMGDHPHSPNLKNIKPLKTNPQKELSQQFHFFVSFWVFFYNHLWITELQGKGKEKGISLIPHYNFHPLHRHLNISWAITAESSPLHIASDRTWNENPWFTGGTSR